MDSLKQRKQMTDIQAFLREEKFKGNKRFFFFFFFWKIMLRKLRNEIKFVFV